MLITTVHSVLYNGIQPRLVPSLYCDVSSRLHLVWPASSILKFVLPVHFTHGLAWVLFLRGSEGGLQGSQQVVSSSSRAHSSLFG